MFLWLKKYSVDGFWLFLGAGIWYFFFLVWGEWTWDQDSALWTNGWYFAQLGHCVFGFLWSLNYIYLVKRFSANGAALISGRKRIKVELGSILTATVAGAIWEYGEIVGWDNFFQPNYFPLRALASKGDLDTLIDLTLNPCGAFISFVCYCFLERRFYKKFYFNDPEDEEIRELVEEIVELKNELRFVMQKLHTVKRAHLKEYVRHLLRQQLKNPPR